MIAAALLAMAATPMASGQGMTMPSARRTPAEAVAAMKGRRRVLMIAAPGEDDAALRAQARVLWKWRDGAAARDVSVVALVGDRVFGATDTATALRAAHRLPADGFSLVLLGKDGDEAYRSVTPVSAETLQATIDAMPMRRAGLR